MSGAIADLTPAGIGVALCGLLLAGVIKGATGLGYASCALPFLVYAVGLRTAISLVLLPAMATNIAVALGNGHLIATCRMFAPLYIAILPGIAGGLWLLHWVDVDLATALLGALIISYSGFSLASPRKVLPLRAARWLQVPVGLSNGVLTGLTGSQVMPMVPYFLAHDLDSRQIVQAINLGVLLASGVLLGGLAVSGLASRELVIASVLAIVPALAGVQMGQAISRHIRQDALRRAILLVLAVAGAGLIVR